ncbi:MAG: hypothetical protein U0325_33905 [Polyangiales bacterium]
MRTDPDELHERSGGSALLPLRAAALLTTLSAALAISRSPGATLNRAVAERGVLLDASSIRWLDGPGFGARRVLFLGQRVDGVTDLHVATVRTAPGDRLLELSDLSNLTRSPDAAEALLCTNGPWAAFATRVDERFVAVTLVRLAGEAPAAQGVSLGERVREAVSRWQQTGRRQGYGVDRFELLRPASSLDVTLTADALRLRADGEVIEIRLSDARALTGGARVRRQQRLPGTTGWVTWMVDTVRAVPWIGPTPIAWLEHVAFGLQHEVARARVSIGTDHSRDEVAEDLADLLGGQAGAGVEGRVDSWPPPPMRPPLPGPLPHEGEWIAAAPDDPFVARNPGAPPAFYQSFVRTDRERPDTRVYVTLWDPRQVSLHVVPGSQEPMGSTGETGTGTVPRDAATLTHLAAGFNGGFQALHGEWGVYAESTLFLPPKPWGATIFALEDGRTGFGSWPGDRGEIPPHVAEFRQNLTSLVEDGVFNPYRRTFWGGNVPGAPPGESHTARTGLCHTREDAVAFFWGRGLTERSLADAMLAARCDYGVHLDMNGANTGFEFLRVTPRTATPRCPDASPRGMRPRARSRRRPRSPTARAGWCAAWMRWGSRGTSSEIRATSSTCCCARCCPENPCRPRSRPRSPARAVARGRARRRGLSWPFARARVRPDAAQPDRWVNLLRVDARRVTPGGAPGPGTLATVRDVEVPAGTRAGIGWRVENGAARWVAAADDALFWGPALSPDAAVTRGACIDAQGWLVLAVADRAAPGLLARAFDRAGCTSTRVALRPSTSLTRDDARDLLGAAVDPAATPRVTLRLREEAGAVRVFPEVLPVPQRVWWDAQHRRVRYRRDETGGVQVRTVGGSVSMPSWGGSRSATPPPGTPTP